MIRMYFVLMFFCFVFSGCATVDIYKKPEYANNLSSLQEKKRSELLRIVKVDGKYVDEKASDMFKDINLLEEILLIPINIIKLPVRLPLLYARVKVDLEPGKHSVTVCKAFRPIGAVGKDVEFVTVDFVAEENTNYFVEYETINMSDELTRWTFKIVDSNEKLLAKAKKSGTIKHNKYRSNYVSNSNYNYSKGAVERANSYANSHYQRKAEEYVRSRGY